MQTRSLAMLLVLAAVAGGCGSGAASGPAPAGGQASTDVRDIAPAPTACATISHMIIDYTVDARGSDAAPADQARRRWAKELLPGDRIRQTAAGHARRVVRLVRDGRAWMTAQYDIAPRGGWILTEEERCQPGHGQGEPAPAAPEPDPAPADPVPVPADPDHVVCAHVGGDGEPVGDVCVPATPPAAPPGSSGSGGGSPPDPGS